MIIPSGQVTFLFTDIEGSTRLAQDFPESLPAALEKHDLILQNAIERNRGFAFEIIGDAFCCSFQKAEDAVKAAVEMQVNLAMQKWDDAVIKIRIGIHSGNAEWNGKEYMGYITLARSARIMSAAYGEQIIISNNAYSLCSYEFLSSKNISFRDLGERRLKDVIQPIRLFQVLSKGLRENFPPLKTLDVRPNNLPVQLTSFIGREEAMRKIKECLGQTRLLTMTGSGGAGKTRLSLQTGADIIDDFANGVFVAELASLNDPSLAAQTVLNSLGVKEQQGMSAKEMLVTYLEDKEILLILDNCEHLISECSALAELLLSKCPKLKIIATSREALNCQGEMTYRVPSLTLPDASIKNTPEKLSQYEAVRLFIERALMVNKSFRVNIENAPALAQICSQLDGIPLAIELAAVRIRILTLEKICEKLNDRFRLLTGGQRNVLPRQQTLKALIDWSYELLNEKEKMLLQRLSVFSGGWTLEAAEEVCSYEGLYSEEILELLSNLIDKSLVTVNEEQDNVRYKMLETIRQFALEKQKDLFTNYKQLSDYFYKLVLSMSDRISGPQQRECLEMLSRDIDNFRTVIKWATENEPNMALKILDEFGKFLEIRGYHTECFLTAKKVLDANTGSDSILIASVSLVAGYCASMTGEFEDANKYLNNALEIYRESGSTEETGHVLNALGLLKFNTGKFDEAKQFYEESYRISEKVNSKNGMANSMTNLGALIESQGNVDLAFDYYEKSLTIYREFGQTHSIARTLANMGTIEYYKGNYEKAISLYEDSYEKFREIGDIDGNMITQLNLGNAYFNLKDFDIAEKYYENCLTLSREFGNKSMIAHSEIRLGDIALSKGELDKAMKIYTDSIKSLNKIEELHKMGNCFRGLGYVNLRLGNCEKAVNMLAISNGLFEKVGVKLPKGKQDELEAAFRVLKSTLGENLFESLWEEGKMISLEEAVDQLIRFS